MDVRAHRIRRALVDMEYEAQRAFDKHGAEQTMDASTKSDGDRLAILMEEVGEVAHELTYDQQVDRPIYDSHSGVQTRVSTQRERLRKELIQVGAMAATWASILEGGN